MSTELKTSSPVPPEGPPERPRLNLSATQVVASALAAITATVAASYLGIAGTVIGAGVASVVTVCGNAVYGHSLARMRPATRALPVAAPPRAPAPQRRGWTHVLTACLGVFAGVLAVVTGVELVAGKPLADVVRGEAGSGTSVLGSAGSAGDTSTSPTQKVTVTVTPTVVTATPTVTVTGSAVTSTVTPTTTTTRSASTTPASGSASGSTSGSSTPTTSATPTDTPTQPDPAAASAG